MSGSTHLALGFLLMEFSHLVLIDIGGVIVIYEIKPGPGPFLRNIVSLMDLGHQMLWNVSSCLEFLGAQGTLVRPFLLRSVAQQMLLDGCLSGEHLPTALGTGNHGLVIVRASNVYCERLEVVELSSTHLTLMNVRFGLVKI